MKDLVEMLRRDILDLLVTDDCRIVDQNIDLWTEGFERFIHDLLGCFECRQITLDPHCDTFGFGFDTRDELCDTLFGAFAGVGYGDFGAAGGKVVGYAFTDAAGCSGYDGP